MNNSKKLDDYPEFLKANRDHIESGFIFSLWNNPDAIGEYDTSIDKVRDFKTPSGIFYYSLAVAMYKIGYRSFDEASIFTYLSDKPKIEEVFEKRGGMSTVHELTDIFYNSNSNLETYHDELLKSNALMQLHDEGYNLDTHQEKFSHMTYSDLEDFMEFKLNNIFLKSTSSGMTVADLTSGYDRWIEKWDSGDGVGFKVGFPFLNYHLAGVHTSNLFLHLGGIGQGKSTSALLAYVLPIIESGEQILIVANEQNHEQFSQMMLATVLFNRVSNRKGKMNRQKLLFGSFSDEEKDDLARASEYLAQFKGKLHFVHLTDYGTTNVKRVIKRYAKLGVKAVLFDTMKPLDESSDKAWAEFSETAKMLFQLAQKEDIAIIATAQLSAESAKRKYLDLSCIGKSRAIAETASTVVMFRPLRENEKKNTYVYNYIKGTKNKKQVVLDEDKDYVVYFISKNRYGSADVQIVYERNMSFNTMNEIGYCHMEYDGFGK